MDLLDTEKVSLCLQDKIMGLGESKEHSCKLFGRWNLEWPSSRQIFRWGPPKWVL